MLTFLQGDNVSLLHGWVDFVLVVALSAWKVGNLAELAEQLDSMVEHLSQLTQPCNKPKLPPCTQPPNVD